MSTRSPIPSVLTENLLYITHHEVRKVQVIVQGERRSEAAVVDRHTFLNLLRTELNLTIIDNDDLPDVRVYAGHLIIDGRQDFPIGQAHQYHQAGGFLHDATRAIAAHHYLEANPPTDPKVEALADLLRSAVGVTPETTAAGHLVPADSTEIATRLLATGRIEVKA